MRWKEAAQEPTLLLYSARPVERGSQAAERQREQKLNSYQSFQTPPKREAQKKSIVGFLSPRAVPRRGSKGRQAHSPDLLL
ncbi:hypothetical protein AOLI_G00000710 [Acnodon oligacanthus]